MTKYDPGWVKDHYNEYAEQEWERWDKTPNAQVRFFIHLYYLQKYLQASNRVLDIGAGPGRFTREIAKISKNVVVADISPVQLQLNRKNAKKYDYSKSVKDWVECDVCDLHSHFEKEEFDAVVCYGGPLSYVFDDREEAMNELLYVTKADGLIFLSVMSLWGTAHQYLPEVLKAKPDRRKETIASGDVTAERNPDIKHYCHMFRAAEFQTFLERQKVVIEVLSASDCLSANWTEHLRNTQNNKKIWQHLLEMELEACKEPGCLDTGTFLIAVCRKSV